MAYTPFTKDDQPTMQAFNDAFEGAVKDSLARGVKIEVGSYVGTGTSGRANPTGLTFGFEPKLVIVGLLKRSGASSPGYGLIPSSGYWGNGFVWFKGQEQTVGYGNYIVYISQTGKTLSWYGSKNEQDQQNVSGYTYGYIAIG